MPYRKKTIRRMLPTTRRLARLVGDTQSLLTKLKNYLEYVDTLEHENKALKAEIAYLRMLAVVPGNPVLVDVTPIIFDTPCNES